MYLPKALLGAKYIWVTEHIDPNTNTLLTLLFHLYVLSRQVLRSHFFFSLDCTVTGET